MKLRYSSYTDSILFDHCAYNIIDSFILIAAVTNSYIYFLNKDCNRY